MSTRRQAIPKHTARSQLTRERIVETAVKFADKQGLDALSMRSLAKGLGFGVMSLYNHVNDKDDLLEAMVEAVASEIEIPEVRTAWKADLRSCIVSAYRMMVRHPWLPGLWGRTLGYAKNRYHDAILRLMREGGFPEELACRGFHALTMHVVGFSLQVLEMPFATKQEFVAFGKQHLKDLEEQDVPYLRDHVRFHLEGKDTRSDFKYMLDLILDGLEQDLAQVD
jgi:AcrR family transcriptional regulator